MANATTLPSSLPDDVIFEILSWVPVKSVCRFRCVTKGWHALISGPPFVAAHRARVEPLLLFLGASCDGTNNELRLVDVDGNLVKAIKRGGLSTCNYRLDGPLCLADDYWVTSGNYNYAVNVIDLATGNVMGRTSAELNHEFLNNLNVGCAAPSGTYKLVCLKRAGAQQPCKVLTLEDGAKWRQMQSPSELVPTIYNHYPTITINGVMHFLYMSHVDEDYHHILRLDLESEEWRPSIKVPMKSGDQLQGKTQTKCMVKLNDTLCIVQESSSNIWLIWLLNDPVKGTWIKAYTLPMASPVDLVMPLTVMHDGRKLLFYVYDSVNLYTTATSTLQVYDPLTGKCTQHLKFADNLLGRAVPCDLQLENFVSPKISLMAMPNVCLAKDFVSGYTG